jgi:hypothetical protein
LVTNLLTAVSLYFFRKRRHGANPINIISLGKETKNFLDDLLLQLTFYFYIVQSLKKNLATFIYCLSEDSDFIALAPVSGKLFWMKRLTNQKADAHTIVGILTTNSKQTVSGEETKEG